MKFFDWLFRRKRESMQLESWPGARDIKLTKEMKELDSVQDFIEPDEYLDVTEEQRTGDAPV